MCYEYDDSFALAAKKGSYVVAINKDSHRKCAGCFGGIDKDEECCAVPMSNKLGDRWYAFLHNHLGCLVRLQNMSRAL